MLIARSIVAGVLVAAAGSIPWSLLVFLNIRTTPDMPWCVPLMILWLFLWWRFLNGTEARNQQLRARSLSPTEWRWSLLAGGFGTVSAIALLLAVLHLTGVPKGEIPDTSKYPLVTIVSLVIMGAAVAGIAEEAGFRGFMQLPIEKRYGPAVAITTTSILFGVAHLSHGWSAVRIGADIVFGFVYGLLAYAADSILPGIVLHSSFDAFQFVFARSLRQLPSGRQWIWIHLAESLLLGIAAWLAFRKLATVRRRHGGFPRDA